MMRTMSIIALLQIHLVVHVQNCEFGTDCGFGACHELGTGGESVPVVNPVLRIEQKEETMSSNRIAGLAALFVLLFASLASAGAADEVRLFQSYFYDSPISQTNHVQPAVEYSSFDGGSSFQLGANAGLAVNQKLEVQGLFRYLSLSPDEGDGESGLSDIWLFGRYNVHQNESTEISAGGLVSLPVGKEEVGQGHLNFGGFAALRYALDNGMVIAGSVGLIFYEITKYEMDTDSMELEEEEEYESSLRIAGGFIYPVNEETSMVGELAMEDESEFMMVSGGVDHNIGRGRVRIALGAGLDDGAPDLMVMAGFLLEL